MRLPTLRRLAALAALPLLAACGDDGSGPPRIDEVQIRTAAGQAPAELMRGQTLSLTATALRGGAAVPNVRFRWTSSDAAVATVDSLGVVTGVDYGQATITAEPLDATGATGQLSLAIVGPPVARIRVVPDSAFLDLGDTIQFTTVVEDAAGTRLTGVELEWTADPASAVDLTDFGRAIARAPGTVRVRATAWNDVSGETRLRATPISGLVPPSGRFGLVDTIRGTGLPTPAEVYFSGEGGSWVRAFVQSASASEYQVWVPVGAADGPLRFVAAADSFRTSSTFDILSDNDVFEPNDSLAAATSLSIPFHNPSLVAASGELDIYLIQTATATPLSIHLIDRGDPAGTGMAAGVLARLGPGGSFDGWLWQGLPFDFVSNARQDSIVYSHVNLPPGIHYLFVLGIDPRDQTATPRRPYGLRLAASTSFAIAPDRFEPNDFPREAPTISLPFSESAAAENPWIFDYYIFTLADSSTVQASVSGPSGDLDLFLIRGSDTDVFSALDQPALLVAEATTPQSSETITATVGPGTYTVAVAEAQGQATTYSIQVTAAAPAPFALEAAGAAGPILRKRPFPGLAAARLRGLRGGLDRP